VVVCGDDLESSAEVVAGIPGAVTPADIPSPSVNVCVTVAAT
jgi:hypothetical protein